MNTTAVPHPEPTTTQQPRPGADADVSAATLQTKLSTLINNFVTTNPQSRASHDNARKSLPGGNTRSVLSSAPFPLTMKSGKAQYLTSIDGKEYLDFTSNFSEALYGHSHPVIEAAVKEALSNGFSMGAVSNKEAQLAEILKERFASIDYVRFCNSGTEANTFALLAALAFTGRKKVLVFRNGYHGGTLTFANDTNPMTLPFDFVLGEYCNIEHTRQLITSDLGAILVEPMQGAAGMLPATAKFLTFLREEASRTGAVLIFDEVITSRLHYNGLQGHFGICPDMTTLGKYIGGGFSFGAFGGRADIMSQFDPAVGTPGTGRVLTHSGTFNNNVFTMTAALAGSKLVTRESLSGLNALGDGLRQRGNEIARDHEWVGIEFSGMGSAVGVHFGGSGNSEVLRDCFYFYMLERGIMVGRRGFVSLNLAHREEDVDRFLDAVRAFAVEMKSLCLI
ncbi:hypothetical protein N7474_004955 [Penicillium riverlandense]|uniref:uncharacterized protein n=1 Tax=Penicillium riverlandense TaxID=1903569 RepID=UPI002547B560|nr:uncharacterized protein N7474_004955 [Penicillium riverlandense]KAJ5819364.1 hypothetical protein N7474_004955 [Penicillium riverlandense]